MKKKGSKGLPPISTASLPDVIFMILFFFMVSTTMRDQELLVRYKLPEATEVQKLEKKSLVSLDCFSQCFDFIDNMDCHWSKWKMSVYSIYLQKVWNAESF